MGGVLLNVHDGVLSDKTTTHTFMPANVCRFSRSDIQVRLSNCLYGLQWDCVQDS